MAEHKDATCEKEMPSTDGQQWLDECCTKVSGAWTSSESLMTSSSA
jgi:hypothetical protein